MIEREAALRMWREACGKHAVDANRPPTGLMLAQFARRVEAAATEALRAENATLRNAQLACEHCDPDGHAVAVAIEVCKKRELIVMDLMMVMAAAVELTEPTP